MSRKSFPTPIFIIFCLFAIWIVLVPPAVSARKLATVPRGNGNEIAVHPSVSYTSPSANREIYTDRRNRTWGNHSSSSSSGSLENVPFHDCEKNGNNSNCFTWNTTNPFNLSCIDGNNCLP